MTIRGPARARDEEFARALVQIGQYFGSEQTDEDAGAASRSCCRSSACSRRGTATR